MRQFIRAKVKQVFNKLGDLASDTVFNNLTITGFSYATGYPTLQTVAVPSVKAIVLSAKYNNQICTKMIFNTEVLNKAGITEVTQIDTIDVDGYRYRVISDEGKQAIVNNGYTVVLYAVKSGALP